MRLEAVQLENERIRLEPHNKSHVDHIWPHASAPDIWRYMPTSLRSKDDVHALIDDSQRIATSGNGVRFAIFEKQSGDFAGSTSYMNVDLQHLRVEIGFTWLVQKWRRTFVNTEVKLMLLEHAFESLGCIRVEFKTDALNRQSREALKRIGAVEEGTLRNHMIMPDGRYRHSVYFSILESEWSAVKRRLRSFLEKPS